jgi:hypothetical protein
MGHLARCVHPFYIEKLLLLKQSELTMLTEPFQLFSEKKGQYV